MHSSISIRRLPFLNQTPRKGIGIRARWDIEQGEGGWGPVWRNSTKLPPLSKDTLTVALYYNRNDNDNGKDDDDDGFIG